jgi:hypothetical protein
MEVGSVLFSSVLFGFRLCPASYRHFFLCQLGLFYFVGISRPQPVTARLYASYSVLLYFWAMFPGFGLSDNAFQATLSRFVRLYRVIHGCDKAEKQGCTFVPRDTWR